MKRHKRDISTRAFNKGYRVGVNGKSMNMCPNATGDSRQQWLNGWRQGRSDYWDGYQGISSLHCAPQVP